MTCMVHSFTTYYNSKMDQLPTVLLEYICQCMAASTGVDMYLAGFA